jgi:Leucine-rich repeat (LRR) protein
MSLHLSNDFTGCLPALLKNLKNIEILDLGNNKFSGMIPPWIHDSNHLLQILRLRSNLFNGNIPRQLSQLSYLHVLDLAENNFTGSIPKTLANLSSVWNQSMMQQESIDIWLHTYAYGDVDIVWKGQDYIFQSTADFMAAIDLSCNSLSGGIPSELTELKGLRMLNLSRNYLVVSQNRLAISHS